MTATRTAPAKTAGTVTGMAVVYNTPTVIHTPFGSFEEVIAPHALTGALTGAHGHKVALLRDHVPSLLLARRWSGTLELTDTAAGLRMTATLPPTALGRETFTLVDRGDLAGMSFAFTIADDGDTWHEPTKRGGLPLRVIQRVARLYEVTITTWPAYEATTVAPASRAATSDDVRRRHFAHRVAMGGGWPRGRHKAPPRELWAWCHRHPVRVGTEARSTPPIP